MSKYTFELKIEIVSAYTRGDGGYQYLAKKYHISSPSIVSRWVNAYREFGEEGLLRKRKHAIYTVQYKLDVIELYMTTELSINDVANYFGMNNPPLISSWLSKYRQYGVDGLTSTKGRPPTMKKEKAIIKQESITNKIELDHIKALEKQVRMLQIENAYLKELRRLRKVEEHRLGNQSQELSTASEEHSN